MLRILLVFCALSVGGEVWASKAPVSRAEYCRERARPTYFLELARESSNYLAFRNHGGLFNKGVCWWHSLFQRASLYLGVFQPQKPKPDFREAVRIVHSLAAGRRVVEIPGYKNIYEFSQEWEGQIQRKLEEWQLVDGVLKFKWINGLSGSWEVDPEELKQMMDEHKVEANDKNQIVWTMWQLPGISAHSGLLLHVSREPDRYTVDHLDSNFPWSVNQFNYRMGAGSIHHQSYDPFVPYPGRMKDLKNFKRAGDVYCSDSFKPYSVESSSQEILDNDLE